MKKNDKLLLLVFCSLVVLLGTVLCLAINAYIPKMQSGSVQTISPDNIDASTKKTQNNIDININSDANNSGENYAPQPDNNTPNDSETAATEAPVANPEALEGQALLDYLSAAVNKTMQYKGNVTVNHTEGFEARVVECSGGDIALKVANTIVTMVMNPKDEVLEFSNGLARDSDNEVVGILIPISGVFSLDMSGVSSITAEKKGSNTVITLKLIRETVDLYDIPKANSSAVGYFNINGYDTSLLEIQSATIDYTGTFAEIHVRPDGYVDYGFYEMPMHVDAAAKGGKIEGTAVFEGKQTEIWQFNW